MIKGCQEAAALAAARQLYRLEKPPAYPASVLLLLLSPAEKFRIVDAERLRRHRKGGKGACRSLDLINNQRSTC
jgi:hypothetical protein